MSVPVKPPVGGHLWLPTVTMQRYQCQRCYTKVTKAQLVNDEVPRSCKPRPRRGK